MTDKVISNIIEFNKVNFSYGKNQILFDLNFSQPKETIMSVIGGSGSGKSTMMNCLVGLLKPQKGSIKIFDKDIVKTKNHELSLIMKKIGVAYQFGALFSSMTIGENIKLPLLENTKINKKTADIMMRMKLEFVGLRGYENYMPSELSGGMVKRAALARALIADPKLLVLDEPGAGLDPIACAALDELIIQTNKVFKTSIVVITHDLESVFKISDKITVLDRGNILISDKAINVKKSKNPRVQGLLKRTIDKGVYDEKDYIGYLTNNA